VIERRGRVLSSEFWISVDGDEVAHVLDTLPFSAVQELETARRHRLEVVRDGEGYSIREDGRAREHVPDAEAVGRSVQDRITALAMVPFEEHAQLHAGFATYRGRGVLFAGAGRSGKTTLMARLLYEGFAVQGDDGVVLRDRRAMAFPRRFRMRRGTLALIPQLSPRTPPAAVDSPPNGYHVLVVDPVELGFAWQIAPVPVDAVFFLVPVHGSPSRVLPCPRYQMAARLMSQSIRPATGARAWIREIAALVERATCYVLEIGELDSAVRAVRDALAEARPTIVPLHRASAEG
jgi:hypothetical protein